MARKAARVNIEYDSDDVGFDDAAAAADKVPPVLGLSAEFELVDSLEEESPGFSDENEIAVARGRWLRKSWCRPTSDS
jgi:hypothetical protein